MMSQRATTTSPRTKTLSQRHRPRHRQHQHQPDQKEQDFRASEQPLPEVKERLPPNLPWRKEKETEGFHGWKEPESKERFGFDPSLVECNSMEAQEEDNDDSQLIKSQRTKWELIRGNQQAQSNLKDQAPSN